MMLRRLKEDVEKNLAPKEETIIEVGLTSCHILLCVVVVQERQKNWIICYCQVELTNIQKKYYRAILEKNFTFLSKGGTGGGGGGGGGSGGSSVPNLLNTMMELRKCCNHPYLINGIHTLPKLNNKVLLIYTPFNVRNNFVILFVFPDPGAEEKIAEEFRESHGTDVADMALQAMIQAAGKLVLIDKLLPKLKAGGHRVLVFSQMVRCLDILEDYLIQKR